MNQQPVSAEKLYQSMFLMWVTFIGAIALLGAVTYFVAPGEGSRGPIGILPFVVLSLGLATASLLLRRKGLSGAAAAAAGSERVMKTQQAYVLAFALSEAAAVMGVVGRFVTGDESAYMLIVVGGVALLLNRPTQGAVWEAAFG
jgi:hypothetical protein